MTDLEPTDPWTPPSQADTSLYWLLRVLLEYRWFTLLSALVLGAAGAALALSKDRTYTAHGVFMPQTSIGAGSTGGLAALAGRFGVAVPSGDAAQSPAFYVELLGSRELLGRLLADTFVIAADQRTGTDPMSGTLDE